MNESGKESGLSIYIAIWQNTRGDSGRVLDSRVRASPASLRCCPWARHIYPILVLVHHRKTRPCLTKMFDGT